MMVNDLFWPAECSKVSGGVNMADLRGISMQQASMDQATLLRELRRLRREDASPVDGALLVSHIVDPATDSHWCRGRLGELAALLPIDATAADIAAMLAAQGFRGSETYYQSSNSSLQSVLQTGEGIPITLAMVLLGVCELIDIPARGINFPGHFLVMVDDVLVDPFEMGILDELALQRRLRKMEMPAARALVPATPAGTVLRMLNNLSAIANANEDVPRALELSDYKLAVAEDLLPLHLERVALWRKAGVISMARQELLAAIELVSDGSGREELRRQLAELEDTPSRLH